MRSCQQRRRCAELAGEMLERHALRAQRTLGWRPELERVSNDAFDRQPLLGEVTYAEVPEDEQGPHGNRHGAVGPELGVGSPDRRAGAQDIIDDGHTPPLNSRPERSRQQIASPEEAGLLSRRAGL